MPNPGSISSRVPYGSDASVRRRQDIERTQKEQAAAKGLAASQIGAGGTLKVDGTLEVDGDLVVPAGSLTSPGGSMSAGVDVGAGRDVNAGRNVNAASGTVTAAAVSATSVTATNVTATNNVTGLNVFAQSLSTNITAARVALWGRTADGYIATAASAQRFKTALETFDLDARARVILQVTVGYFQYLNEIARRDDPTSNDYVGPDYHVATNLGAIADQLADLGLWEWVVWEREPITELGTAPDGTFTTVVVGDQLKLDADNKPIPFAIHDILVGWASLIVCQYQEKRIDAQAADLSELKAWAATQGFSSAAA